MPTPYEFGLQVGALSKTAAEKHARNFITDLALYSNPFTGVPTSAYDTYNHVRNGRYLNALGSAAMGGLSLTGAGFVGNGVKSVGNVAMRAGLNLGRGTAIGGGLVNAGRAVRYGGKAIGAAAAPLTGAVQGVNNTVAQGVQKVLPVRAGATFSRAPVQAATNWVAKNPIEFGANLLHSSDHTPSTPPPNGALQASIAPQ